MLWYEAPLRLGLAVLFGLIIGLERERRHRPAGVKTHILVCMGAALVSLIQMNMIDEIFAKIAANPSLSDVLKSDYSRLGAQVISGIGFLGAGTIIKTRGSIQGLTTASTIWLIGCMGLAVGMGYYYVSIVTMVFVILVLSGINLIQNIIRNGKGLRKVDITLMNKKETMRIIKEYCIARGITIRNIEFVTSAKNQETREDVGKQILTYEYSLIFPHDISQENPMLDLYMEDNVVCVTTPARV